MWPFIFEAVPKDRLVIVAFWIEATFMRSIFPVRAAALEFPDGQIVLLTLLE